MIRCRGVKYNIYLVVVYVCVCVCIIETRLTVDVNEFTRRKTDTMERALSADVTI